MTRASLAFVLILLVACARSEDASIVVDTNEGRAVEQVRSPERDDDEMALGEWRETLQQENEALEFGPAGASPVFSLRCDERRGIILQRHGAAPTGDLPMMLITTGNDTRRLAVTAAEGAVPMLRAALTPRDPFLETLTGSNAPITIRIGDAPPLVLPASPAIGTFVAGCASGDNEPETGNQAAAEEAGQNAGASADPR